MASVFDPSRPATRSARDVNRERVAIYCRVSSDEQAQAGTIQNQIEFARRYCDLHGLPIYHIYADEGVSGRVPMTERPAGSRLLADAREGKFGAVLVYRIDRLARSTRILLATHDTLKAAGVTLRSMTEPFDTSTPLGEFIMTLLGSLAELERATIVERMTLGKHRAAREGRWPGGAPPYGYRVEGPEHDRRLVVDEDQAAVVRRIFHLYVHEGMGLIPIAELLNAEGVPSPYEARGRTTKRWPDGRRRWSTGTLSRLLRNSVYVGRYRAGARSGQEIAECETPRLVDDATYQAAQRLLGERFIEATRNARRLYLLRGLIRCHCGRTVVGDGHRSRAQYYYVCPADRRHFRMRAEVLEGIVVQDIAAWARDPGPIIQRLRERLAEHLAEARQAAEEVTRLRQEIAARQAEQDRVITLYRKGRITDQQLDTQLDALNAEIAVLQDRYQQVFQRQVAAQSQEAAVLSAEALLGRLRAQADRLEHESSEEADRLRRDVIKLLVAGMQVQPDATPVVRYRFAASPDYSAQKSA
jgi:site-specific DNA recombinase